MKYGLNSMTDVKEITKPCAVGNFVKYRHVDSTHKGPVTLKAFPRHDVIMLLIFVVRATSTRDILHQIKCGIKIFLQ